jgi:hypothetical protein
MGLVDKYAKDKYYILNRLRYKLLENTILTEIKGLKIVVTLSVVKAILLYN